MEISETQIPAISKTRLPDKEIHKHDTTLEMAFGANLFLAKIINGPPSGGVGIRGGRGDRGNSSGSVNRGRGGNKDSGNNKGTAGATKLGSRGNRGSGGNCSVAWRLTDSNMVL
jgi:hypothetical protein